MCGEELVDLGAGEHKLIVESSEEGTLHVMYVSPAQFACSSHPGVVQSLVLMKLHCDNNTVIQ